MGIPELLAPAGSMESLTAALRCGADAAMQAEKAFQQDRTPLILITYSLKRR